MPVSVITYLVFNSKICHSVRIFFVAIKSVKKSMLFLLLIVLLIRAEKNLLTKLYLYYVTHIVIKRLTDILIDAKFLFVVQF